MDRVGQVGRLAIAEVPAKTDTRGCCINTGIGKPDIVGITYKLVGEICNRFRGTGRPDDTGTDNFTSGTS